MGGVRIITTTVGYSLYVSQLENLEYKYDIDWRHFGRTHRDIINLLVIELGLSVLYFHGINSASIFLSVLYFVGYVFLYTYLIRK